MISISMPALTMTKRKTRRGSNTKPVGFRSTPHIDTNARSGFCMGREDGMGCN